jgi:cytochrome c1
LRIRSAAVAAILLAACEEAPPAQLRVADGSAARGRVLAGDRGCGACHVIPGVAGAVSWAGPPLSEWARRGWLAGRYPNTPEQLVAWLRDPQALSPGSAMPDLGLNAAEARDIAAYLMTLGAGAVEPVPAGMPLGPGEGGPRAQPRLRPRDG